MHPLPLAVGALILGLGLATSRGADSRPVEAVQIDFADPLGPQPSFAMIMEAIRGSFGQSEDPAPQTGGLRRPPKVGETVGTFAHNFGGPIKSILVTTFNRERAESEEDTRTFLSNYLETPFHSIHDRWRWADGGSIPILAAKVTFADGTSGDLIIESLGVIIRTSFHRVGRNSRFGVQRDTSRLLLPTQRPEVLLPRLTDSDPMVRKMTIAWLSACAQGNEDVGRQLLPMIRDPNIEVRWQTAWALASVREPIKDVANALLEGLRDSDSNVRSVSALSLGNLGATESIPTLLGVLANPEPDVRAAACSALGMLGSHCRAELSPGIVAVLIERLEDPVPEVRMAAIRGLSAMMDRAQAAIPALSKAASSDADPYVRGNAIPVLEQFKTAQRVL